MSPARSSSDDGAVPDDELHDAATVDDDATIDDDTGAGASGDDPMARGLEALQRAAQEAIAAARAMLDVADDLVRNPDTAGTVLGAVSSFARMASQVRPPGASHAGHDDDSDDDGDGDGDGDGGVQRIPVS